MVTIVGVGPGHPDYLTPVAKKHIDDAEVLIGSRRLIDIFVKNGQTVHYITGDIISTLKAIDENKDKKTVIVVGGDPGFYSILGMIRKELPDLSVKVIPGISSAQILFSLIGQEWQSVTFVSVHGRSLDELDYALKQQVKKICVLTDKKTTASVVAKYLKEYGVSGRAVVGCNLSYDNQTLIDTTIDEISMMNDLESCVLYVEITTANEEQTKDRG
ncbi:MAG: precorrin-6y C5,15-methyltransferase (decarboxylating) subunit CbiE [Actinomycetota bacterium]|nr:precorrin-6y C5,15-methyltransferase (decarboxylating) subunit CbiE [Actinomycetota bacterium]